MARMNAAGKAGRRVEGHDREQLGLDFPAENRLKRRERRFRLLGLSKGGEKLWPSLFCHIRPFTFGRPRHVGADPPWLADFRALVSSLRRRRARALDREQGTYEIGTSNFVALWTCESRRSKSEAQIFVQNRCRTAARFRGLWAQPAASAMARRRADRGQLQSQRRGRRRPFEY